MSRPDEDLEDYYRLARRVRMDVARPVRTRFAGAFAGAFHGPGLEFEEFAPYQPGDEVQRIDWLVTARRRRPYVRRYTEERSLRMLLVADVSRSMDVPAPGGTPRRRACKAIALLALSAAHSGDRTGALLFGGGEPTVLSPRTGSKHAMGLLTAALANRPEADRTDPRPALRQLRNLRGHALVVLLSDFLLNPPLSDPQVRRLLRACTQKHELLGIGIPPVQTGRGGAAAIIEGRDPESGRRHRREFYPARGSGSDAGGGNPALGVVRRAAEEFRRCGARFLQMSRPEKDVQNLLSFITVSRFLHRG